MIQTFIIMMTDIYNHDTDIYNHDTDIYNHDADIYNHDDISSDGRKLHL